MHPPKNSAMPSRRRSGPSPAAWLLLGCAVALAGCRSPSAHRERADQAAAGIIDRKQSELFDRDSDFSLERPVDSLRRRLLLEQDLPHSGPAALGTDQLEPVPHWPEPQEERSAPAPSGEPLDDEAPLVIDLLTALQVGARNSRDYQDRKEDIYRAALDMDLEDFAFRNSYQGVLATAFTEDRSGEEDTRGVVQSGTLGATRTLRMGAELSSRIMVDLVKLLTLDRDSAYGVMADLSVNLPLLRGAGRHVVTEPLTQAERDVMYAMYTFEDFKRRYAVRVASAYLQVLQQLDQVRNAEDNYERVELSAQRARRLADAGRLPEIQVDQAQQEELRARDRWLSARSAYELRLDQFKVILGLPADARVELDGTDLRHLTEAMEAWVLAQGPPVEPVDEDGQPVAKALSMEALEDERILPEPAIRLALDRRLDLAIAQGRVADAQRAVTVAADALRWRADLSGSARAGQRRGLATAGAGDARLDLGEGAYGAALDIELPWSRVAQRNAYRARFIALERATRQVQDLEDQIKSDIRTALRDLVRARESMIIQARSVELAQRRVDSTELFLQAGRAQIRDVLEAQEALVSARNALTSAVVAYRVAELDLQRDMGVLEVGDDGLWTEFTAWDE